MLPWSSNPPPPLSQLAPGSGDFASPEGAGLAQTQSKQKGKEEE